MVPSDEFMLSLIIPDQYSGPSGVHEFYYEFILAIVSIPSPSLLFQPVSRAVGHYLYPKPTSQLPNHVEFVFSLLMRPSDANSDIVSRLYMQNVLRYAPLAVAVHLLPQAIGGIIVNIIAGLILHRVNNKLLAGIGTLAYTCSSVLLATMKEDSSYWAFIFPSLLFAVIGADLQFNVANVCFHPPLFFLLFPYFPLPPPPSLTDRLGRSTMSL